MRAAKIKYVLIGLLQSLSLLASIDTQQSVLSIKVVSDGIYRVNYADIIALGVDLTGVDLTNIAVTDNGNNIPVNIVSDNNLTFGQNSYIDFVGISAKSLYQQGRIYSLVLTDNVSIKLSDLIPQDDQQVVEYYLQEDLYAENKIYSYGAPIADPWFTEYIRSDKNDGLLSLEFEIDNLLTQADLQIEINIWGGIDFLQSPDHHVIYEVNNDTIGDIRFDGVTSDIREYLLDSTKFTSGTQHLTVRLPNDTNTPVDIINFESLKVTYPRAFVLSNKQIDFDNATDNQNSNPDIIFIQHFESQLKHYRIINATNENYLVYKLNYDGTVDLINYLASEDCSVNATTSCVLNFTVEESSGHIYIVAESEVKSPELSLPVILSDIKQGSADYLIIAHPDFIGAELDEFVELKQQNYTVKVVDVEQIYAQYGFANVSAASIAAYIKFASDSLDVSNVLLVGGDTYDYENYEGSDSISFIPTLYGRTGDLITFAPIDAKFADIDDDNIPDINIGRFPVRTESELANLLLKIQAYSSKTYNKTAVFAADRFDVPNGYSFKADADDLINLLPIEWQNNITTNNRAYLDDDGVVLAKSKLIENINQGVALTSFMGHSGKSQWSKLGMFSASDANLLTNANSPTLVTQWGCWNTYFVSPSEDTLAHAFMLNQNGGAVSVLGASTLTEAEHEKDLAQLILTFLTHDEMTLGNAVTEAKRIYAQTNPDALDVILGWNILGDPGLRL